MDTSCATSLFLERCRRARPVRESIGCVGGGVQVEAEAEAKAEVDADADGNCFFLILCLLCLLRVLECRTVFDVDRGFA